MVRPTITEIGRPSAASRKATIDKREDRTGRDVWLGVELRHLAALVAVEETGSFRGAARRLGYVQSAVSQQIAFLERLLGLRLVDRSPGPTPVKLTPAGMIVLRHASDILEHVKAARADLLPLHDDGPERLRIGVAHASAGRLLAEILSSYARAWSDVRVGPRETATEAELLDLLERGELDAVLVDAAARSGPFAGVELIADPHVLLVHESSRLVTLGRTLQAGDLAGLWLTAPGAPDEVIDQLRALRIPVDDVARTITTATAQSLARARVGGTILPRLATDPRPPQLRAIELGALLPPRRLALRWHAQRCPTAALTAFRDIAVDVCRTLALHNLED